ncbi:hypothetical protein PR048_024230 [Dryococelus australis]|uniref:Uncharacterized protein n=1 Tax=Dryococelus australis TaxID=614101 RepID=A0ABQ9GN22_9NEOP|nr:hypothetical protein PR048_024230 [Dryococelus australis]
MSIVGSRLEQTLGQHLSRQLHASLLQTVTGEVLENFTRDFSVLSTEYSPTPFSYLPGSRIANLRPTLEAGPFIIFKCRTLAFQWRACVCVCEGAPQIPDTCWRFSRSLPQTPRKGRGLEIQRGDCWNELHFPTLKDFMSPYNLVAPNKRCLIQQNIFLSVSLINENFKKHISERAMIVEKLIMNTEVINTSILDGAAVAERRTTLNRLPDFRMSESCRSMPLLGGFSRGSLVFSAHSFRRCSIPQLPTSALKTSLLRATQIIE